MSKSEFQAEIINEVGVDGYAEIKNSGEKILLSWPTNDLPGTNPEELFGLALSGCLNATLKVILKAHHLKNNSRVRVTVDYMPMENGSLGYYFAVEAYLSIEGMSVEEAAIYVEQAEKRCPVSKLVANSDTVHIHTVAF